MTFHDMIRKVTLQWADHPVCVFQMGKEYTVAVPNTPDCVELELTKGIEFIGTYFKTHPAAKASVAIMRDL